MNSVGEDKKEYAKVLYVIFAIFCASVFTVQIVHLRKMKILPVFLQPLLSFCMCFENCLLSQGTNVRAHSPAANAGYFFHSLIFPIFIIILFEVTLRLHEARCTHFWGIPFEQGTKITYLPSLICVWVVRFIATGLFVMNIFATYGFLESTVEPAGKGGYATFNKYPRSRHLWLSLVPSIVLSVFGYLMGIALYRYGKHSTLSLRSDIISWSVLLLTVILQMVGQCFNESVYPVTSNAGNICLLFGVSWMVHKVQRDLILAGTFADFLHTSNMVYKMTLERAMTAPQGAADAAEQQFSLNNAHHYATSMTRTASTRFAQVFSPSADGTVLPLETEMSYTSRGGHISSSSSHMEPGSIGNITDHRSMPIVTKHDPLNDEVVIVSPQYELVLDNSSGAPPHNGTSISLSGENGRASSDASVDEDDEEKGNDSGRRGYRSTGTAAGVPTRQAAKAETKQDSI